MVAKRKSVELEWFEQVRSVRNFPMPFLAPNLRNLRARLSQRLTRKKIPEVHDGDHHHANPWLTQAGTMASIGNSVEPLVDGAAAFGAAARAIDGAEQEIHLLQMQLEPEFVPEIGPDDNPTLVSRIQDAGARGVKVRLLLSKVEPVDVLGYEEIEERFDGALGVQVLPFPMRLALQHAKMLTVDGREAFLFGSLFSQTYWDRPEHALFDPRRGKGSPGIGSRPLHDVSVRLRGPVVADIDKTFVTFWNHRCDEEGLPEDRLKSAPPPSHAGRQALQVVRTLPPGRFHELPDGERDLFESYLRALRQARRFIYAENQYYTSPRMCTAILQTLKRAPGLEVILLLNANLDIPTYGRHQKVQLKRLIDHPRVGVFTPWHSTSDGQRTLVQRGYIHSKTTIIDDAWASLGTANFDGFSLHGAEEFGLPSNRNVETNVALFDGIGGHPKTGVVEELRRRLWAEHLGLAASGPELRHEGRSLELWRRVAKENVAALNAGRAPASSILPYARATGVKGDERALKAVGVHLDAVEIME